MDINTNTFNSFCSRGGHKVKYRYDKRQKNRGATKYIMVVVFLLIFFWYFSNPLMILIVGGL